MNKIETNETDNRQFQKEMLKRLDEILKILNEPKKETSKENKDTLPQALQNILNAVKKHMDTINTPPTVREIARMTTLSETTVSGYLNTLAMKGFLDRIPYHKDVGESRRVRLFGYKPK